MACWFIHSRSATSSFSPRSANLRPRCSRKKKKSCPSWPEGIDHVSLELRFSLGRRELHLPGRVLHGSGGGGDDGDFRRPSLPPRPARKRNRGDPLALRFPRSARA